ncbi:MAG TPA: hypothetical protein VGM88_06780 [Kofleriaceae bacterium]|jgi:hypothetical protein
MLRCLAIVLVVSACGSSPRQSGGDAPISHDTPGAPDAMVDAFGGPYDDFPAAPILDGSTGDVSGLFTGSGATSGGPCLIEPELGTLFPKNWLRPRFSWVPNGDENLFELTLQTANETNVLTVYTSASTWTMPDDIWTALSAHIIDQGIFVRVRGAAYDGTTLVHGPELGASGSIAIAPADAPGAIVYWTTSNGTKLRGFHVGDESVTDIVTLADTHSQCIGCHTSTPDGMYVGLSSTQDSGNGDPATLVMLTADGTVQQPSYLTPSAQTLMARTYQELPSYSVNHYMTGDRVALTEYYGTNSRYEIMWTDLEATSTTQNTGWGILARTGDTGQSASASFAHTSDTILYVTASDSVSGVTVHDGDLATIPYNSRMGGQSTKISGADTAAYNEYYPTFSPDDRYVAYNRIAENENSYNSPDAEVYVIPSAGGDPTRIAANDPVQCGASPRTSPGVTNSWPKWAPAVTDASDGKRYYWLTFSSTRLSPSTGTQHPQLFVSPVVDDGSGNLETFPALYLWNQPDDENNHTPAWDNFTIVTQ